jgi:hypothetical protein
MAWSASAAGREDIDRACVPSKQIHHFKLYLLTPTLAGLPGPSFASVSKTRL